MIDKLYKYVYVSSMEKKLKRKPAVGGYFYPNNPQKLKDMIKRMVSEEREKKKALSVVSPHAGFEFSGYVAGAVFSSVELPSTFILLGPNHRYAHSSISIMKEGIWETPLGEVPVNSSLAEKILNNYQVVEEDEEAHFYEHSLEVQLPFIQFYKKDISIVPLTIAAHISYEELECLGKAVAESIKDSDEEILIVASTDMSHYVPQEIAQKKDFQAIQKILELDSRGLYEIVTEKKITMCGYQPTTAAVVASRELGAKEATLIKYQTSGDVIGSYREVVGYAGLRIS